MDKIKVLEEVYQLSFQNPRFVAEVYTSGSYAKKVRKLAKYSFADLVRIELLCQQVEHLRKMIKIVDDLVDEDTIRDNKPAFWVVYGVKATIWQASYELKRAREIAQKLRFEQEFEEMVLKLKEAVELEIKLEQEIPPVDPRELWFQIVEKESAFRKYIAQVLGCPEKVVQAMWLDGVAGQILDDARSALYGKDGRLNSDERLGRLTFMRAFECSPEIAEKVGELLKALVKKILEEVS